MPTSDRTPPPGPPATPERPVLLVCAFGPFPGVAVNPSEDLARRLVGLRRPALSDMALELAILPTRWSSLEALDATLARLRPAGILMMGAATRRRTVDLESWAVNGARPFPDAARQLPAGRTLVRGAAPALPTTAALAPLAAALRRHRVPVRRSGNAGRYLCNAAYFHALRHAEGRERAIPVVFIHLPGRTGRPRGVDPRRMTRALSALLVTFAAAARHTSVRSRAHETSADPPAAARHDAACIERRA